MTLPALVLVHGGRTPLTAGISPSTKSTAWHRISRCSPWIFPVGADKPGDLLTAHRRRLGRLRGRATSRTLRAGRARDRRPFDGRADRPGRRGQARVRRECARWSWPRRACRREGAAMVGHVAGPIALVARRERQDRQRRTQCRPALARFVVLQRRCRARDVSSWPRRIYAGIATDSVEKVVPARHARRRAADLDPDARDRTHLAAENRRASIEALGGVQTIIRRWTPATT